jgi:two-component system, NtrC family, response regulator GlrR
VSTGLGSAPSDRGSDFREVASGTLKVVVTEDEALLREMIVRMLRLEGYLVFEFGTADATIETVDRHLRGVDLLISDIHLPQKDGLCLFDTLRQSYPELRAVFVSGDCTFKLPQGASLLSKPFDRQRLLSAVREALQ